jgi:hypothetical protein
MNPNPYVSDLTAPAVTADDSVRYRWHVHVTVLRLVHVECTPRVAANTVRPREVLRVPSGRCWAPTKSPVDPMGLSQLFMTSHRWWKRRRLLESPPRTTSRLPL